MNSKNKQICKFAKSQILESYVSEVNINARIKIIRF